MVKQVLRRVLRRVAPVRVTKEVPRCVSVEARSEQDVAIAVLRTGADAPVLTGLLIRQLVELNTPALYLNIVQPDARVHVVLRPAKGRSIRFRGRRWFLDAGSEAPEGVEAFTSSPMAHVTQLYPVTPDHPVYVMSIEHQGDTVYTGDVPSYLTHVTIVVNGHVVARAERVLHERGPQVYAA